LSLCVQIFIESLLNADSTTDVARDTGTKENSLDIKKGSRKAMQSETSPSPNFHARQRNTSNGGLS
jgi:hypothetical protein